MACPDRRLPVPGRAAGQGAGSFRWAPLSSWVSMETAGIFRVTINSLITVFNCHLSLTKDKRKSCASARTEEAATAGERAVSDCCHVAGIQHQVVMLNLL